MKRLIKDKEKLNIRVDEIDTTQSKELAKEVNDCLVEYLEKHPKIDSIAANQFGYNVRAVAIRFKDSIKIFFNPMVIKQKGSILSRENNPTISDKEYIVPRNEIITLAYQKLDGEFDSAEFKEGISTLFQQLIDLLNGVFLEDFGLEVIDGFDDAPEEERQEVINWYLESLKKKEQEVQEDIDKDPKAKEIQDAIRFLTAGAKGEVTLYSDYEKQQQLENMSNRKKRKLHKIEKRIRNFGKKFTKKKKK